ncbi:S16 family serine protease [Alteribacter aurantiacus]|uniref:S16 family serine protease n=1 Tax=Alteribacter aurantiacus TaxID=254410 RepID=UPI00047D49ED|nr:S16 family serine protease [Alteribacter aurantiacus]
MKTLNKIILLSVVVSICVYALLLSAYLLEWINGFVLIGSFLVLMILAAGSVVIFRRERRKKSFFVATLILLSLFMLFEIRLLNYESHTYEISGYLEPEDLLGNSNIYLLSVNLHHVQYIQDEEMLEWYIEGQDQKVYDVYPITNRMRYRGKSSELVGWIGLVTTDFERFRNNAEAYLGEDVAFAYNYFNRDDLVGNSAGLAIGLKALINAGHLENSIPIGVTGTMEADGHVREVGMIREKLLISEENQFPYMIVPNSNLKEAEEIIKEEKLSMTVIGVASVEEAKKAVENINDR